MASMIMNRTWTLSRRERPAEKRTASIICPVTFSSRDLLALRYAARLARQRRGKLIILHVVANDEDDTLAGTSDTICEEALARLERFVPMPPGVQCEWVVLQGDVADQVVEFVAGCDTPQIVMATGGRKTSFGFMGHIAEAVLRQAPCPVVIVNDDDLAPGETAEERRYAAI